VKARPGEALPSALAFVVLLLWSAGPAHAFACLSIDNICLHWQDGHATMLPFLGSPGAPLLNGTLSWNQNAINAANDWSSAGANFHFDTPSGGTFQNPCGPQGTNHACPNTGPPGDNPIFFSSDACGEGFGTDIVEMTLNCYTPDGLMINAPIFVNSNVPWNAYDGALRPPVNDMRRVLLHELGHVLGLDHPDAHGQNVPAIMNSRESNIDRLQPDDIDGILSLYGSAPNSGAAPASANTGCQIGGAPPIALSWMALVPAVLALTRPRRLRGARAVSH
jgi:hypothetical protein